jgi:hypothetical protein
MGKTACWIVIREQSSAALTGAFSDRIGYDLAYRYVQPKDISEAATRWKLSGVSPVSQKVDSLNPATYWTRGLGGNALLES